VGWVNDRIITANFCIGRLYLWDSVSRSRIAELPIGPGFLELDGDDSASDRLAISGDGSRCLVVGGDNVARIFSIQHLQLVSELQTDSPKLAGGE
jgi:hypothetical protein